MPSQSGATQIPNLQWTKFRRNRVQFQRTFLLPRSKKLVNPMPSFRDFVNSPVGPKTTHFWGPAANFSFVVAGLADVRKPADKISGKMTAVLCVYSLLGMRFGYMVRPRNHLLMVCHASNETIQLYLLSRWAMGQRKTVNYSNE